MGAISATIIATAALAPACGDPVVTRTAYEAPLLTINGMLQPAMVPDLYAPRMGVVWVDPAGLRDDLPSPPEITGSSIDDADQTFVLSLYAPPPPEAIRRFPGPPPHQDEVEASFALGEIVLYEDLDGDGTFRVTARDAGSQIVAPDLFRAGAEISVVYVERPLADARTYQDLGRVLEGSPGYRIAVYSCADPPYAHPPMDFSLPAFDANPVVVGDPSRDRPTFRGCLRSIATPAP